MKKATKLLFAALLALAAIMTSGCALSIVAPSDQWVEYEYPYQAENGTKIVMRCYLYYTETGKKIEGYKSTLEIKPGLTIVATPKYFNDDKTNIAAVFGESFTKDSYFYTTFENNKAATMNDGTKDSSFTMSYSSWVIIYNSILHEDASSKAPTIVKDGTQYSLKEFNWKKLLYTMAYAKLGELLIEE